MKGIAIRTILLILIGVIVLGVFAYLIYKASRTKTLSVFECKAKLIDICRICKNVNWSEDYDIPSDIITECSKYPEFFYWTGKDTCDDTKVDCELIVPS